MATTKATKAVPARKAAPVKAAPAAPAAEPVLEDEVEPAPYLGEHVLVAVHPDIHDGRDDVAPATVTRVTFDDDEVCRVNLRVHYDAPVSTGHLLDVPWYSNRGEFEAAEERAFLLLPGHKLKAGKVEKPGENHFTQAPWQVEDVRHWQTGAWPADGPADGGE
jgi:hypothetical protein